MRLQSVLKPWPLAAIWSVICLILAIVGLLFVSEPSGNGDLLAAAATPSVTYGDVATAVFLLWVLGIVVLLAAVVIRRISRTLRRATS
jgi:hypothetical protein